MSKITIERETLEQAMSVLHEISPHTFPGVTLWRRVSASIAAIDDALSAALAAQAKAGDEARAELARLRAVEPVGWIGPSGFTENTPINKAWMSDFPKIAAKLSPVYAAPPAQPAEQQAQTVCKRTLIEIDARLRECSIVGASAADAYDTFYQHMVETALAAQPAEPIEARSRYETAYAGRQLPHTQTTTSEPVQRLSDARMDGIYNAWRDMGDDVSYGDLMRMVEAEIQGGK